MSSVVSERVPIAAVDFVELSIGPAQGVADPTGGASDFFLGEKLEPVSVADPLGDLLFPIGLETKHEARPVSVAQQSVHLLVVAFEAELKLVEGLG